MHVLDVMQSVQVLALVMLVAFGICGVFFIFSASKLASAIRRIAPERMAVAEALDRLAFSGGEAELTSSPAIIFLIRRQYKFLGLGRDALWGDVALGLLACVLLLGLCFVGMIIAPLA